jgi:small subunit ribosomal protein S8
MMSDPISDMLSRIRNGALARHDRVEMPHSTLKHNVAQVLKSEGFIDDVRESEGEGPKTLTLVLRYSREKSAASDKTSAIDGVRRVSAPGRRVYVRFDRIPRVRSGMGISGHLDPFDEPRRHGRPHRTRAARGRRAPL